MGFLHSLLILVDTLGPGLIRYRGEACALRPPPAGPGVDMSVWRLVTWLFGRGGPFLRLGMTGHHLYHIHTRSGTPLLQPCGDTAANTLDSCQWIHLLYRYGTWSGHRVPPRFTTTFTTRSKLVP